MAWRGAQDSVSWGFKVCSAGCLQVGQRLQVCTPLLCGKILHVGLLFLQRDVLGMLLHHICQPLKLSAL